MARLVRCNEVGRPATAEHHVRWSETAPDPVVRHRLFGPGRIPAVLAHRTPAGIHWPLCPCRARVGFRLHRRGRMPLFPAEDELRCSWGRSQGERSSR
jgi:hypothetical protein